jgi:hypothetical protein
MKPKSKAWQTLRAGKRCAHNGEAKADTGVEKEKGNGQPNYASSIGTCRAPHRKLLKGPGQGPKVPAMDRLQASGHEAYLAV